MCWLRSCWFFLSCLLAFALGGRLSAQELRATVRISTESLGAVEQSQFEALERQLTDLLNNRRWTTLSFSNQERIPCSFALRITEAKDMDKYRAELSVTASRTVYNTNYTTTTYVYRDKSFDFEYASGQSLDFNPQSIDNNLVAVLAFHALTIISLDFDSFSPLAGDYVKDAVNQLVTLCSSQPDWQGWKAFDADDNRGALWASLSGVGGNAFRQIWYRYHRLGLDQLEGRIESARREIKEQLKALKTYQRDHFRSPLIALIETAKIDEITNVYEQAPVDERREVRELLTVIFPTRSDVWSRLKN